MKLVLFDVDGTLLDSQNLIHETLCRTLMRMQQPLPERSVMLSVIGLSLEKALHALLGEHIPFSEAERAAGYYRQAFRDLITSTDYAPTLFSGACDVVDTLWARPDTVLGIATGKSRRGVDYILEKFGWQGLFITIQTADSAPSKPDPGMILQAARETGLSCADIIMVGDTTFDIDMGRAAGARTVGVSWGNHPVQRLQQAGADSIIDSFDQLIPFVDALTKPEYGSY